MKLKRVWLGIAVALVGIGTMWVAGSPSIGGHVSGTAWAADSVDEAKEKSKEAWDAITKALHDVADKAEARTDDAISEAREKIRIALKNSCDAAQNACEKVCDGEAKCLKACKEGRKQCQS
jgi:hypothetical protein